MTKKAPGSRGKNVLPEVKKFHECLRKNLLSIINNYFLNFQKGDWVLKESNWNKAQKIVEHSNFSIFEKIHSGLTNERQEMLFNNGAFGHFSEIEGIEFPKKLMHLLVLHQLESKNSHELWFSIGGNQLIFTLNDFALMSGM